MKIFGLEIRIPKLSRMDRRHGERCRTYETLYVDYSKPFEPGNGTAEGVDISMSGVRFACPVKIPKGTLLRLFLRCSTQNSNNKLIPLVARVIRCYRKPQQKRYRIACAFDKLDPSSHQDILAYLSWLKETNQKYLFYRYGS